MALHQIYFQSVGRRGECPTDKTLLDCAHQLGVGVLSTCDGYGVCQACKVQVLSGTVSEPTSSDRDTFSPQELKDGWRLACQTFPTSDCKVSVPPDAMTTPFAGLFEAKTGKTWPTSKLIFNR